ncbi:MAG: PLDc N-terminal domain-containing protein [Candidatus Solibacter sp.]|nr:PLDc N-terminal domain-containing protein [Candidatus Solibacter sp.]
MANGDLFGVLVALPIGIAGFVFWFQMLADCAMNEHGKRKFFWTIVVLMPNFAGVLIYYFVKWRPRRRAELGLA